MKRPELVLAVQYDPNRNWDELLIMLLCFDSPDL